MRIQIIQLPENTEKHYNISFKNRVRIADRTPEMLVKWAFQGLFYVVWL